MLNTSIFEQYPVFKTLSLQKDDIVFDEGEVNDNIYIIKSGKVSIEKYTTDERTDVKELAVLGAGNFFGEGALSSDAPKEVRVRALENIELLYIDAKNDFPKFNQDNPSEALYLFGYIISETNKRLLTANKQIIGSFEINKTISEMTEIDAKSVFDLIDKIRSVVGCNYILYLEKNPFIETTMMLKYDTRLRAKPQDLAITFTGNFPPEDFRKHKVYVSRFNEVSELNIGQNILGYLVFGHNLREFNDAEKKMIHNIAISIAGVVHQKKLHDDEKNKQFMKNKL